MRNRYYLAILTALFLLLAAVSCKKEEKQTELTLGNSTAPTATLAHVSDSLNESYTYIAVSTDMEGFYFFVTLEQGSEIPEVTEIIRGTTDPAAMAIQVKSGQNYLVKVSNLTPLQAYDLYAVATNADEGKPGELLGPVSFTAPDNTLPTIVSMYPESLSQGVSITLDSIVLTLSEEIATVNADKIWLVNVEGSALIAQMGSVEISGSNLIVDITDSLPFNTKMGFILSAGACTDISGNQTPAYALGDSLNFTTEELLITEFTEVFNGVYHCVATDKYYSNNIEYDVVIKDSVGPGGYYLHIINFNDYNEGIATLQLFPDGDSAHFASLNTGIVDPTYGEIYVGEYYGSSYSTPEFYQGSFERDGSILKAWGEVFNGDYSYWYGYELTFTKY